MMQLDYAETLSNVSIRELLLFFPTLLPEDKKTLEREIVESWKAPTLYVLFHQILRSFMHSDKTQGFPCVHDTATRTPS